VLRFVVILVFVIFLVGIILIPNASAKVDELIQLGDAYLEKSNPYEAFKFYDDALKEDPNNEIAQEGKDLSWNRMKTNIGYIDQNLAIISEDPENLDVINKLIEHYKQIGDFENSVLWIKKYREVSNDKFSWVLDEARMLWQLGKHQEALVAQRNGIQNVKGTINEPFYYNEEAILLYILGNYKESEKVIDFSISKLSKVEKDRSPRDYMIVEATLLKGMLFEQMGKDKDAEGTYEYFSKYADSFGDFSSNVECSKGLMLFRYGDFKQALVYLDYVTEDFCEGSDVARIISEDRAERYSAYAQDEPTMELKDEKRAMGLERETMTTEMQEKSGNSEEGGFLIFFIIIIIGGIAASVYFVRRKKQVA